jgi:IS5 family transposase
MVFPFCGVRRGFGMRGQAGFFDVDERLKELSAKGDHLERLNAIIDFELFRADLEQAVPRADRSRGGRPAFDHVFMFKVLVLQSSHSLSDERTEFLIKDRLSFMRFLGLGLADPVPDANTIWTFREALTRAQITGKPAIEVLFAHFDRALREAGFLAIGGQIIDASLVACPKHRNTDEERQAIKEGRIPEGWSEKPAKLAQKDRDARWTVKWSKAKPAEDGSPRVDIAVPVFGYKNHVGIDRRHGLIRSFAVTDAAQYDGALRPVLLDNANTASDVWADTAYRSKANEKHLADNGLRSRIHRKKPKGKPMPAHIARANGRKSKVRAAVEHVFAHQKGPMELVVRTIGLARARVKIGLANLVFNMKRMVWLTRPLAAA